MKNGRTIFSNIKKFIAYILTSNIPEILPFFAFVAIGASLALTVVLHQGGWTWGAELPETGLLYWTAPIGWYEISLGVPFAIAIILGGEFRRWLIRRDNRFVQNGFSW